MFFPEYTPGPLVALGEEIVADITKPATDRKTGNRHEDSSRMFFYAMPWIVFSYRKSFSASLSPVL